MMIKKKNIYRLGIFIPMMFLAAVAENSCHFLKEISTLGKCEFRLSTLEDPVIAGVDVSQVRSFTDLNLADMGIISASILKGDLPLSFTLNVEVRNPNPAMAALNGLEYLAFIDDVEVARGQLDRRVEIPANGGISTIPLRLATDLIDILKKDSRQALVNFGLNLADAGKRPTRVSLRIKPVILVGGMEINYPGYFTVKHDFTSGGEQ
jgi:LEA14-like dessication related protein